MMMIDPKSERFPVNLQYRLFTSKAFRDLKPVARMVLILLYLEIIYHEDESSGKFYPVNIDEIGLPYNGIRNKLGYTDMTIYRAINNILAHGFMKSSPSNSKNNIYSMSDSWEGWTKGDIIYTRDVEGYVYIIQKSIGIVKVGISIHPERRISNLENMNGEKFIKTWISDKVYNSNIIEKRIHDEFAGDRVLGEWFKVTHKSAVEFCQNIIEAVI